MELWYLAMTRMLLLIEVITKGYKLGRAREFGSDVGC